MNLNSCWQTDMKSFSAYNSYHFSSTLYMYMLIRLCDFSMLFGQCFCSLFPYPVMFSMLYRTYYFEYILKICFADSASSVLSKIARKNEINFYWKLMIMHNFVLQHLIFVNFQARESMFVNTAFHLPRGISLIRWICILQCLVCSFIYTYHSNWFSVSSAVWISWH